MSKPNKPNSEDGKLICDYIANELKEMKKEIVAELKESKETKSTSKGK